jgi:ribose 1,5-bisphosphate isomerase
VRLAKVHDVEKIAEDIRSMKIRGAGRIARAGAEALLLMVRHSKTRDIEEFLGELEATAKLLYDTRPTAVSLPNGIRYVTRRADEASRTAENVEDLKEAVIKAALMFIEESKRAVEKIGEIGARRVEEGDTLLTHCNSESAISVITTAWKTGKNIHAYVTETRPRFQGRETAKIFGEAGIPTTLIVDGAARHFMNKVDKVIVGADAITANGAVVNKIGTSMIALAAKEARTPFCVAAETYKFSPETTLGELLRIEERSALEVLPAASEKGMGKLTVRNPAFDVTPSEYVDLIITEKGIISPQAAVYLIQQEFGWSVSERSRTPYMIEEE